MALSAGGLEQSWPWVQLGFKLSAGGLKHHAEGHWLQSWAVSPALHTLGIHCHVSWEYKAACGLEFRMHPEYMEDGYLAVFYIDADSELAQKFIKRWPPVELVPGCC